MKVAAPSIRFRVDFAAECSVGFGKIALLEQIGHTGSLTRAARTIGMSYRRAWLLMESLNTGFDRPVVTTSVGGSGGGGAALTPFGREMIARFRTLETKLLALTQRQLRALARHARCDPARAPARSAHLPRQRLSKTPRARVS
jgi:molybdate transport system regulatory protein